LLLARRHESARGYSAVCQSTCGKLAVGLARDGEQITIGNQVSKVPSRSHDAVIRVYDAAGNVVETHEHKGDFKEP